LVGFPISRGSWSYEGIPIGIINPSPTRSSRPSQISSKKHHRTNKKKPQGSGAFVLLDLQGKAGSRPQELSPWSVLNVDSSWVGLGSKLMEIYSNFESFSFCNTMTLVVLFCFRVLACLGGHIFWYSNHP